MSLPLLITGSTGKQGSALIHALAAHPTQSFKLYALTRSTTSTSAHRLKTQHPNITLLEGNLSNPTQIVSAIPNPIWGLFAVPIMDKGHVVEEAQSKALTAAAVAAGVKHIVFTSTDRGGQDASEGNPTSVPHFASKFRVEEDIRARAGEPGSGLTYTFLRPVAFFENMTNNFIGKAFASMWRLNGAEKPLQLIATSDIGKVAAEAFLNHDKPDYRNVAISLAGDEISVNEAANIFREEVGKEMSETYGWLAAGIRWAVADLREMFRWFKSDGFGVDVAGLRKRYPYMKDFRAWLREESAWKKSGREA